MAVLIVAACWRRATVKISKRPLLVNVHATYSEIKNIFGMCEQSMLLKRCHKEADAIDFSAAHHNA